MTWNQERICEALRAQLADGKALLPEGAEVLWEAFQRLSLTRGMGPRGPLPISFAEIEAYTRLMRMPLEPDHVRTILAMDEVLLEALRKRGASAPSGAISAMAFDAVFG